MNFFIRVYQILGSSDEIYQSNYPNPTKLTHNRNDEKGKTVEDKNGESSSGQEISIDLAFESRQSHTIKQSVTMVIPQSFRVMHKCPVGLQSILQQAGVCFHCAFLNFVLN